MLSSILLSFALAEIKIGYVDSNEIMKNIEEFRQAQIDLEKEGRKLEAEGIKLVNKLDSLRQEYDRQRLLMSDTRRKEKEKEMTLMEQSIQQFQLVKEKKRGPCQNGPHQTQKISCSQKISCFLRTLIKHSKRLHPNMAV